MSPQEQLRLQIAESFSLEEIKILCLDLSLRYDELPGDFLSAKITALLIAIYRLDQLPTLHKYLTANRPNTNWVPLDQLLAFDWSDLVDSITFQPTIENHIQQQINAQTVQGDVVGGDKAQGDINKPNRDFNQYNFYGLSDEEKEKFLADQKRQQLTFDTITEKRIPVAPLQSRVGVENFIQLYLGNEKIKVPFGGRDEILKELDAWLADETAPQFGLMAAEAGRGKSAVLVRWAQQLVEEDHCDVIFFPISIRFGTTQENQLYHAIAWQLYRLYGEEAPRGDGQDWRGDFVNFLKRRRGASGRPIAIIIDGLDEGSWAKQIKPNFLPSLLGEHVRLLISARFQPGDENEEGWLARLGWDQAATAKTFLLPPLGRDGIADVLTKMGNPLDNLATDFDILERLLELTEDGDPFLIRLFVDALVNKKELADDITPSDLLNMEPGVQGFFKKWWKDQIDWWRKNEPGKPYKDENVKLFLNLLSVAEGALLSSDILELAEELGDIFEVESLADRLNRFIYGDGDKQGYVFTHPRFAYHFRDQLIPNLKCQLERRFLAYGKAVLDDFSEQLVEDPHDNRIEEYGYMLTHFGSHLERAISDRDLKRLNISHQDLKALISEGWLRAKVIHDGGRHDGFLRDIDRLWKEAQKSDTWDVGAQILCVLCHSSVVTVSGNMNPILLKLLVEDRKITPAQAFSYVDKEQNDEKRATFLIALLPILANEWYDEVLLQISSIKNKQSKADTLVAFVPYLTPGSLLLRKAIEEADQCWYFGEYNKSLIQIFQQKCSAKLFQHLISRYLSNAEKIQDETSQSKALSILSPYLDYNQLDRLLHSVEKIQDNISRSKIISTLAPRLDPEHRKLILDRELEATNESLCLLPDFRLTAQSSRVRSPASSLRRQWDPRSHLASRGRERCEQLRYL